MKKTLFLLAAIVGLSGCAIKPVSNDEAKPVPVNRIIESSYFEPDSSKVLVVVKRDQGHVGSACTTRVFINKNPVVNIRMSEKATIYLKPGKYILSSMPTGVCGGGISEIQVDLTSGESVTYRIGFDGNATHRIQPTAF